MSPTTLPQTSTTSNAEGIKEKRRKSSNPLLLRPIGRHYISRTAHLHYGKFETIVGSKTITPEREGRRFRRPLLPRRPRCSCQGKLRLEVSRQLKGKVIGVTLGETHQKWARNKVAGGR